MIHDDVSSIVTMQRSYDAEGARQWIRAAVHGALTALTPYYLTWNEYGYITVAITDNATGWFHLVVPPAGVGSGVLNARLQIAGTMSSVVTPSLSMALGHALGIVDGAVTDEGADPTGEADEWAVATTATSSASAQDVLMFGERLQGDT